MIVLDTHAWIWWVSSPSKLSKKAAQAIDQAPSIGLSPISVWELSTKVAQKKLELDRDLKLWIRQALHQPRFRLLEISPDIALRAGQLGLEGLHGDPADRLIVATALQYRAALVTKDHQLRSFRKVRAIW